MSNTPNPLSEYFRSPKLYVKLPTGGKFYTKDIVEYPESGELPIFPMTAKDELIMKNPDALLNGEAVIQLIKSCVPNVKNVRRLISNDVDVLLVAIQGATSGDDIEVSAPCPGCDEAVTGIASVEGAIETMAVLEKAYTVETEQGLKIEVKPLEYSNTIKAGIASFQSSRSLQVMSEMPDDMDKLKLFNESFVKMADMNYQLIVAAVHSVTIGKGEDANTITDRDHIKEFLDNCESSVGASIEQSVAEINKIGIQKTMMFECDKDSCKEKDKPKEFEAAISFDPVNFFTAS
tara:strand:- start:643 stop:1515 length:873 start_codon:yes stop_codon:yes gene_type:complete